MKRHLPFSTLAVAGCIGLAACADQPATPLAPDAAGPRLSASAAGESGRHLVVFKQERIPADFTARVEALGGSVAMAYGEVGAATVAGLTADAAAALRKGGDVSAVEPEVMLELVKPVGQVEPVAVEALPASPTNPAGASFYPRQWNMRAIGAQTAWAAGELGSDDVTVAILDTGIGYTHADLQGRVDLARSVSFVPQDDQYVAAYFPGAHPVADIGYHGTHVAATVVSNGMAAAGVTSKTTLMGVKVCSVVTGGCPGGAVFAGIRHAVDNGADVINMSLGGSFQKSDYPGYVSVLNRLFTYANRNNVTVVVSAGNSALDIDHDGSGYKTYCSTPNTVCISATGPTGTYSSGGPFSNVDAPAYYTNYGRSAISVAAPGGNDGGYVHAACSPFSLTVPVCQTGTYIVGLAGTSMAAPHASGLAALMVQKYGKNPARVASAIQQSADDLGQAGTDAFYGKGRINVARALGL